MLNWNVLVIFSCCFSFMKHKFIHDFFPEKNLLAYVNLGISSYMVSTTFYVKYVSNRTDLRSDFLWNSIVYIFSYVSVTFYTTHILFYSLYFLSCWVVDLVVYVLVCIFHSS